MPILRRHWPIVGSASAGLVLALCYPGFNISALVWLWMVPLLFALWLPRPGTTPRRRAWRGFGLGYLAGLVFFLINLSWLHHIHLAASTLLPAFLALYFGVWGMFAATAGRPRFVDRPPAPGSADPWEMMIRPAYQSCAAAALNAGAWCGLEWVRGWLLTGFGWNGLGVALHRDIVLAQAADLVGVTGLAFLIVFCASVAAGVLLRARRELGRGRLRGHLDFGVAVALVIAVFFYGSGKLGEKQGDTVDVRVLLIQGGVPQDEKWDASVAQAIYDKYWNMTNRYLQLADFDLVVWPESSLPYSLNEPFNTDYLNSLLAIKDFEFVLGLNEDVLGEGIYNSIVALRGNVGSARTYRKVHLVPFGEFVPFRDRFPFLDKLASNAMGVDFQAGHITEPLEMSKPEPYQIIPLVCFEDIFGKLARKFVRQTPQLIVNVTNDGWFGHSSASAQHLANAKFRCIELRRPMVRCANTGVSCLIDSVGSLYDRWAQPQGGQRVVADPDTGSTFVEAALPEEIRIPRHSPTTLYARVGDAFSITVGAIALLAAVVRLVVGARRTRAGAIA